MNYPFGTPRRSRLPFGNSPYPWTLRLIAINIIVFIVQNIVAQMGYGGMFLGLFALRPPLVFHGFVWQLFTYMFLHGSMLHILFNMFVLWMMGREVEMTLGSANFLKLYFICGLVAGLCSLFMWNAIVLGASGAVLGILAAYGQLFPDRIILAFFFLPMKVKHFIWVVAAIDLFGAINGGGNVAHLAHIGGLFTGIILMKTGWYRRSFFDWGEWRRRRQLERQRNERQAVDDILDKVSRDGIQSLSRQEREFLERMRYRR